MSVIIRRYVYTVQNYSYSRDRKRYFGVCWALIIQLLLYFPASGYIYKLN